MGRPVYSTCFLACQYPAAGGTYDVPAGDTAILTHMTLWIRDNGPFPFGSLMNVELDVAGMVVWYIEGVPASSGVYQWTGREVFTSQLFLIMAAGPPVYSFRANGYLLTPT